MKIPFFSAILLFSTAAPSTFAQQPAPTQSQQPPSAQSATPSPSPQSATEPARNADGTFTIRRNARIVILLFGNGMHSHRSMSYERNRLRPYTFLNAEIDSDGATAHHGHPRA